MVGCVLGGPPSWWTEMRCSIPRALFSRREIKEIDVRRCEFFDLLRNRDVDLYDVRGFIMLERSVREVRRRRFKALQTRLGRRPIMDERAFYEEYELKRKQKHKERMMYYQKRRAVADDKGKQKLMDGDNAAAHHQEKRTRSACSSDVGVDDDEAGGKRFKQTKKTALEVLEQTKKTAPEVLEQTMKTEREFREQTKKLGLKLLEEAMKKEEMKSDGDVSPIREESHYRNLEMKGFYGPYF